MNRFLVFYFFFFISSRGFSQTREIKIISYQPELVNFPQISFDRYPLLFVFNSKDTIWLRGHLSTSFPRYKYLTISMQENDSICLYMRVVKIFKSKARKDKNWKNCPYYDTVFVLHPWEFNEGFIHIISPFDKKEKEKTFTISIAERKVIKRLRKSKPQAIYNTSNGTIQYIRKVAQKAPGEY